MMALLSPATTRATEGDYRDQLIATAHEQRLQQRPEWIKLLHYKAGMVPGSYKSEVDATRFFFAPDGKTDPDAELVATLTAFFGPFPDAVDQRQFHPQCLFPARYQWLKQELNFDLARLPELHCRELEQWMTALDPEGVTVIFPAAYLNSPASMFGHTLLRIDGKGQNEHTRLLAYSVNFGADTGNDGGLAFAFRGLFGGYHGTYSVAPYYLKVREYSDMENRDIWEYQLDLTEAQTRTLLLHVWEMRGIWFDYFFFDENCSYHLLSIIETARPDLELTNRFGYWAIPSDTIRELNDAGLVRDIVYRPSRRTVLGNRMAQLNLEQIADVKKLVHGQLTPQDSVVTGLPLELQVEVLELAHEYADYRGDEDAALLHTLLEARSTLPVASPRISVQSGTRPDQGHDTGRGALTAGREAGHNYQELQLRPAYHDLLDPIPGYTRGAQIVFFDLTARHDSSSGTARLQSFMPVNIISLTPVSEIVTPMSWQFAFGLTRKQGQQSNRMIAAINGGIGLSASLLRHGIAYALLTLSLDAGRELRNGYAAGAGGATGLLMEITPRWSLHLFAHGTGYTAGEAHGEKELGLEQRYTVGKSDTVRMAWSRERQLDGEFTDFHIGWQRFF
ncbi:MAG: DUF4105 domain-containing protein [Gammaproteobacteria bacterium]|nr:DUF4105 domain-containing protein [Gammaproteobacteria bacterium]